MNNKNSTLGFIGEIFILLVIFLNMVILGLEACPNFSDAQINIFHHIDRVCLYIFIIELVIRFVFSIRNKEKFFADKWNIFDFIIIVLSLVPEIGFLSLFRVFKAVRSVKVIKVLKSFKTFRAMKVVSSFNELKKIFKAIVLSIPGISWSVLLLGLVYYIYAIIGVNLFGEYSPELFGSLSRSIFTLFQVMTFESWCMGIARPMMEIYSFSWIYFISFILFTTYMILNVVVGVVVNSMQEASSSSDKENVEQENADLKSEIQALKKQIEKKESMID